MAESIMAVGLTLIALAALAMAFLVAWKALLLMNEPEQPSAPEIATDVRSIGFQPPTVEYEDDEEE